MAQPYSPSICCCSSSVMFYIRTHQWNRLPTAWSQWFQSEEKQPVIESCWKTANWLLWRLLRKDQVKWSVFTPFCPASMLLWLPAPSRGCIRLQERTSSLWHSLTSTATVTTTPNGGGSLAGGWVSFKKPLAFSLLAFLKRNEFAWTS